MPSAYKPVLWTHDLIMEVLGRDVKQVSGKGRSWQATGVCRRPAIIEPGDLYIASQDKGEDKLRQKVPQMFRMGAVAAIVAGQTPPVQRWSPVYRVGNSNAAMTKLGDYARDRCQGKIIGVTGSVGKTGVKDALLHVLSQSAPAYANYRNANCGWGLPESLAGLPASVHYGVFEMGMLSPGSIGPKSERVRPHVTLITAIAPAHIGYHGSLDSIANTKADIIQGMQPGGSFVVPFDSEFFELFKRRAEASSQVERLISFGTKEGADVRLVKADVGPSHSTIKADIQGRQVEFEVGLGGPHWVSNSLAILATVLGADADIDVALGALEGLTPSFRRGERFRAHLPNSKKVVELIDDTWNANPISVGAALTQMKLLRVARGGRRVAFFGDMLELGEGEQRMHEELVGPIEDARIDVVHTVGPLMKHLHGRLPGQIRGQHFADAGAAASAAPNLLNDGDLVLVKGSNGVNMWKIVHALVRDRRHARSVPPRWSLAGERASRA